MLTWLLLASASELCEQLLSDCREYNCEERGDACDAWCGEQAKYRTCLEQGPEAAASMACACQDLLTDCHRHACQSEDPLVCDQFCKSHGHYQECVSTYGECKVSAHLTAAAADDSFCCEHLLMDCVLHACAHKDPSTCEEFCMSHSHYQQCVKHYGLCGNVDIHAPAGEVELVQPQYAAAPAPDAPAQGADGGGGGAEHVALIVCVLIIVCGCGVLAGKLLFGRGAKGMKHKAFEDSHMSPTSATGMVMPAPQVRAQEV